jgi:hypothetical protein
MPQKLLACTDALDFVVDAVADLFVDFILDFTRDFIWSCSARFSSRQVG